MVPGDSFVKNTANNDIDVSSHAEEQAILRYCRLFENSNKICKINKKLILYVIRFNKKKELKESKPCKHCILLMQKVGINKVIYSNGNGELVCEKVKNMKNDHISKANRKIKLY